MTIALTIDAVPYEIQPAGGVQPIPQSRVQRFAYREKARSFIQKALLQNTDQIPSLTRFVDLTDNSAIALENALVDSLLAKTLVVTRGNSACGASASRPPSATAKPQPPTATDSIDDSTVLSAAMKGYLKAQSRQGDPSPSLAAVPAPKQPAKDSRYEVTVEIAGQNLAKKQSLVLTTSTGDVIKKYPGNDHETRHRSLCRFGNLTQAPCKLSLAIPMKGQSTPMTLPLSENLNPVDNGTRKDLWDTLLVPIKPLQFMTSEQRKDQSDLLQQGWLYVFWQGKLWRELAVSRQGILQDVDVALYRKLKVDQREAAGHWLDAVWVPYLLNGVKQTDLKLVASPIQWTWSTISRFESHPDEFAHQSATLDALQGYTTGQQFDDSPQHSGGIMHAMLANQANNRQLARQQRQKIATAYLPKTSAKLKIYLKDDLGNSLRNVDFELDVAGHLITASTDAQGYLEAGLPADPTQSAIHFYRKNPDASIQHFTLRMNDAAAVDTVKGLQARLNNLGFDAGPVDGIMGRKTKAATREFQAAHGLVVDGISGPQTQNRLLAEHQS